MDETEGARKKPRRRLRRWKLWLIVGLAHLLGFLSSFHAIMSTRTSQGAIAWAVSLNAFPYVALPAYWVLGRNKFQGYVTARRAVDTETLEQLGAIADEVSPYLDLQAFLESLQQRLARMAFPDRRE